MTTITGEEWNIPVSPEGLDSAEEHARILEEANQNIEAHRKSDFSLTLLNPDGTPASGVEIELHHTNHDFAFGFVYSHPTWQNGQPWAPAAFDLLTRVFNHATITCYWDERWDQPIETLQGRRHTESFLSRLDLLTARGLTVKGHPLVWTVAKAIPKWVQRYGIDEQMKFLEHHVRSMVACTDGRVSFWDLCNEMLWEPSLRNLPQRSWPHLEEPEEILTYLEPALHWARTEDPNACYGINDYGLLGDRMGVTGEMQRHRMGKLVELMKMRGCCPDAVGTQAHDGVQPLSALKECFNDLAATGLPVQVTEFMYTLDDLPGAEDMSKSEQLNASAGYMADVLTLAFGTPAMHLFTTWNSHRMFLQPHGTPLPSIKAFEKLIHKVWSTDETLTTENDGRISWRGFHGAYDVTLNHPGGQTETRRMSFTPKTALARTIQT